MAGTIERLASGGGYSPALADKLHSNAQQHAAAEFQRLASLGTFAGNGNSIARVSSAVGSLPVDTFNRAASNFFPGIPGPTGLERLGSVAGLAQLSEQQAQHSDGTIPRFFATLNALHAVGVL